LSTRLSEARASAVSRAITCLACVRAASGASPSSSKLRATCAMNWSRSVRDFSSFLK